jgi:hypothetical protein
LSRSLSSRDAADRAPRRGRPPKFGRPGHVVSVTLPDDTLQALNRVDPDTGWAIVKLLERTGRPAGDRRKAADVGLVPIGGRRALIVVSRAVFKTLPGVNLIPLNDAHAFLALDAGRGMSDLELAVIDRLADRTLPTPEQHALASLREQLSSWRHDRSLTFRSCSIIVVERKHGARGPGRAMPKARPSRPRTRATA